MTPQMFVYSAVGELMVGFQDGRPFETRWEAANFDDASYPDAGIPR